MIKTIITGDLGVNTYLYNYESNNIVVVDPGSNSNLINSSILTNNYIPKAILLTHGHFDHVGAVKDLKDKYDIPVYIHKDDSSYLGESGKESHMELFKTMGPNAGAYFNAYYTENDEADSLLDDNEELSEFGLKVIHTPGHSPGSCCFYSEKNSVVFTGDTMFNSGMGRTDFPGGNYLKLINSLERLKELPDSTKVYPGHGPETTIKLES